MKERIQKLLAALGVASRRQIEAMVLQGRIAVNGRTVTSLPVLVDPATDKINVDGERVNLKKHQTRERFYFLLNKPKGVYCTNVAQGAQVRAIDLLPKELRARLYPVGRLDAESQGLLLLTNDGELTNQLTQLRYGVTKTYLATVRGRVTEQTLEQFRQGGGWTGGRRPNQGGQGGEGTETRGSGARILHSNPQKTVLEITVREGRNRQVRLMLARLGHKVRELVRVRIGPLTLEGLSPGHCRPLTPWELRALRRAVKGQGGDVKMDKAEAD
jgi:23S rRNA pseudouridine2605 synthase